MEVVVLDLHICVLLLLHNNIVKKIVLVLPASYLMDHAQNILIALAFH